jgi:hypothetical protein
MGVYTAKVEDAVLIVPTVNPDAVTPDSEAFQAVIWHLLVTHPLLKDRAHEVGRGALRVQPAKPAIFLDCDGVETKRSSATGGRIRIRWAIW